ncbi:methyltransferase domain-containing protein [Streptomyces sp. B-S-A8]|uniref:Methyltransferase domain-containing protein n=1 Tax=Streptomyces solicavernae TaxID=3043614 RepID=A0ABT6RL81_9ACTN|nr:class I SAM-dependent methyltransferase [Streptomyces sp. B-S-A8]MDI3385050.1 methyltransferase domain-containing protein [Streptomyces sp. B-S-A8]
MRDFVDPEIVNTDQEQAWNGPEGAYWVQNQDRWDAVNSGFNELLLDAAGFGPEGRVLDIGCGSGQTTRLAARRAARGRVLGVDLSAPMLDRARASAAREGLDNVTFERADAQVHAFSPGAFDAAVSRYGVMFFADPVAAFANIGGALRPGGRLAFVCPAEPEGNGWLRAMLSLRDHLPVGDFAAPGRPGMFAFTDPDRARAVLTGAGFADVRTDPVEAYGTWGRDAQDAADFMLGTGPGRAMTAQVSAEAAARARTALTEHLRDHEKEGEGVRLLSTSWLVTGVRPNLTRV